MSKGSTVIMLMAGLMVAVASFWVRGPIWISATALVAGVYICGFASCLLLSRSEETINARQDAQPTSRSQYRTGTTVKVTVDEGADDAAVRSAILEKAAWMRGSANQSKGRYFICVGETANPVDLIWHTTTQSGYVAPTEKQPGVFSY